MAFHWNIVTFSFLPLLQGAILTVEVSLVSMILATIVGIVLGIASLSHFAPLRWLVKGYVLFVRGVPSLVLILLIYFAPPALGIDIPGFWAAVLALTVGAGAYNTEIIRSGIVAIDPGQTEAASAIGLTWPNTLVHVLLPQALRNVIPPLTNELISLVKTTPLLSVVSIMELMGAGKAIVAEKYAPLEVYLVMAFFYFVLIGVLSLFMRYVERKFARQNTSARPATSAV